MSRDRTLLGKEAAGQFQKRLVLELRRPLSLPASAEVISPNVLSSKSLEEIRDLAIWEGNQPSRLGDMFTITGDVGSSPSELCVTVTGNVERIRSLGHGMTSGLLEIKGDAGMYVGEEMCGGRILVEGNAGSWLGSKIRGGTIEVYGDAGDHVGSAYRGSRNGMKGGQIIVHGNTGVEIGCWMNDGLIRVKRNAGMFPGVHMCGGGILIEGYCDGRAGAAMTGGRIIIEGKMNEILPSFAVEEIKSNVRVAGEVIEGPFYVFRGDVGNKETGRLFVSVSENHQLRWCERYLEPWQI